MKHLRYFIEHGLFAAPFGPTVLAVVYLVLYHSGVIRTIAVDRIVTEILTVTLLAFIAGAVTVVYRTESASVSIAILVHAAVLYLAYAVVYLVNGWIDFATLPFVVFSVCFAVGFALTWLAIFWCTSRHARRLTLSLQKQREGK